MSHSIMNKNARLGAHVEPHGVRFSLVAPHAEAVELCLFGNDGGEETGRRRMARDEEGVWHGFEAGLRPGAVYGWRVHGPFDPARGHRFNPAKLLLDPYAREVLGRYDGDDIHWGHRADDPSQPDTRDNAATALKAMVLADPPPMRAPRPPVDAARRVLYEVQLKAFTALHPDVPPDLRGRYAGLAHPAPIAHLKSLGITTVCLMPVAQRADEPRLLHQGLSNHWGYNTIGWSAPENRYASAPGRARDECRAMVDALHEAGFEVVLDVVFNHSAESDEQGPTLSLRGIDNALYYHLPADHPAGYVNWAGCGNVLNLNQPWVLRLVLDSLRRWATDVGIDGFRFDLAPILARGEAPDSAFQPHAAFFSAVADDPVLSRCLMIAEPWDIGPGGYQLGGFPPGWLEWNDRFRDAQRSIWLHRHGSLGELARRLSGSSDVFGHRLAHSSVNFITSHDGFTLMDLVSYRERHNDANGEHNRDGHGHNLSVNHGVEGPSDDPGVRRVRLQQRRALLAVVLLSLGTPMLLAGDEIGHSQNGNNNAYCQDNPTTWLHWAEADLALHAFVAQVIACRHELVALYGVAWWQAAASGDAGGTVALWLQPNGDPMTAVQWEQPQPAAMALTLGHMPQYPMACLLLNPSDEPHTLHLPPGPWRLRVDSHAGQLAHSPTVEGHIALPPRSLWLLTAL